VSLYIALLGSMTLTLREWTPPSRIHRVKLSLPERVLGFTTGHSLQVLRQREESGASFAADIDRNGTKHGSSCLNFVFGDLAKDVPYFCPHVLPTLGQPHDDRDVLVRRNPSVLSSANQLS
jgi:hypothetical protein